MMALKYAEKFENENLSWNINLGCRRRKGEREEKLEKLSRKKNKKQ